MDEMFEGLLYTLEDEEGNEQEFELIGETEYEGTTYCALVPYYENPADSLDEDDEFVILKRETVDGEEMLVTIDDDDEYDAVGNIFLNEISRFYEELDEEAPDAESEDVQ